MMQTRASAESGVSAAGVATMGAARGKCQRQLARASMAIGKSYGVVAAPTSIGCLTTMIRLSRCWPGIVSP
jgi:hypothetical protein